MKMKKSTDLLQGNGEMDWITANGQHIPVGEKESKEEAVKKFVESHENKANKAQKEKGEEIDEREQSSENLPKLDKNKPPPDEEAEELKKAEEQKQRELAEKKQKRQQQLSKDIDAVLAGTYKDSHVTLLDNTPQILQDIGLVDKPMLITAKHLYTCANESGKYIGKDINYHGLGVDFIKQVPQLLESPKLVFRNKGRVNEVVAVVDAKDKQGRQVIVPIKINGKGIQNNQEIEANIVKSIYGRNNFEKYIKENATVKTILYPPPKEEE